MDFLSDNFITDFFKNPKKTDEEFNQFINIKFTQYLNNTNLLANIVKDYETNKNGQSRYCNECKDLYILTNSIFDNYIKKVSIPFNINIKDEINPEVKTNYKNKILYFFNLEDLKQVLTSEKLRHSGDDESNKKQILCKIISVIFIKIYIIIKAIHETFNNYNSLVINNEVDEPYNEANYKSELGELDDKNELGELSYKNELGELSDKNEEQNQALPIIGVEPSQPLEQNQALPSIGVEPSKPIEQNPALPSIGVEPSKPIEQNPALPITGVEPNQSLEPKPALPITGVEPNQSLEPKPALPITGVEPNQSLEPKPALPITGVEPNPALPQQNPALPQQNPALPQQNPALPQQNPALPLTKQPIVGGDMIDNIRNFFPFTKKTEQVPSDSSIEPVKYKQTNNLFYSIFVILFTDYFELNSKNFSEKILKEKLDSLDNERFSKNLSKLAKYFCFEQSENKKHKLFDLGTITNRGIIFDDTMNTLNFLDLKVDYKQESQYNLTAINKKFGEIQAILSTSKEFLANICPHIANEDNKELGGEPKPASNPEPEPVSNPEPEPVSNTEPEPVSNPEPEPVSNPEPEPVSNPVPDQVPTPVQTGGNSSEELFKNINYKAYNFIKNILKKMITQYFYNRRYLYTNIIKNIVQFDKKKNMITKLNDNLTYNKILQLTHKTKYKILELNYYVYKYVNAILKVFSIELSNLDNKSNMQETSNVITNTLNNGFGGQSSHNQVNAYKNRTKQKKITRRKRGTVMKHLTTQKKKSKSI